MYNKGRSNWPTWPKGREKAATGSNKKSVESIYGRTFPCALPQHSVRWSRPPQPRPIGCRSRSCADKCEGLLSPRRSARGSTTVTAAGIPRCVMQPPRVHAASISDRMRFPIRGRIQLLTCNVQDRIGLLWVFLQRPDSFGCRQYSQSDFAAMRFALHLFHDRQRPAACTDHTLPALPGYLLLYREQCMPKLVTELFGRFLALADATAVDQP
jgi:hypothetical protein